MGEPTISLRDLRRAAVKFDGARLTRDEALALVEAVEALGVVVLWIRHGIGDEATAAEKADNALARFTDFTEEGT